MANRLTASPQRAVVRARRAARFLLISCCTSKTMLLAALAGGLGCAGARRGSYAVVPPSVADAALRDKAVVVEGVVTEAEFGIAPRTPGTRYLVPWIPAGSPAAHPGWSATVTVQRVLKGDPGHAVI